jgi:hypothetical protein
MKYLILLALSVLIGFSAHSQVAQDTVKLTPQELFEFNSQWNNLSTTQSYIDFSKDVLNTSDLSLGIVGQRVSTTLNLAISRASTSGRWNQSALLSINPGWKYYGIGWAVTRKTDTRKTTLQAIGSFDFTFQKNLNVSIIDFFKTKRLGNFGYNLTASQTWWGEWEGPWQGEYTVDSLGNWVTNIYPMMPASRQLTTRAMAIWSYPIQMKRVTISPQLFLVSDIHRSFTNGTLDISYLADFNLDAYYGVQMDWKVGKNFIINSSIRFNSTIDKTDTGFKKSNPILFAVGTGF